jgi:hypothetical protein
MRLIDNLVFGSVVVAFLGAGAVNGWWNDRVITILKERHPETWRGLQGPVLMNNSAFVHFLTSDQHREMNDPELSRAIKKCKMTFVIVIVCFFGFFATMISVSR